MPSFFRKTKEILFSEQNNILSTSFMMMTIILVTKVTGFLYSAIVASKIGSTRESDLFILANTIPEILGNLILVGLVSAAIMPVMVKIKTNYGHEKFLEFLNGFLNASLIVFAIVSAITIIFSENIFRYYVNCCSQNAFDFTPDQIVRMANMMRVLLIPQLMLGISAFYSSSLNVYHRFIIPQLAPLFYNLGRIVGVYFLIPIYGGAEGQVIGTILGAFCHLLIQFPLVHSLGIHHSAKINWSDENFKSSMKLAFPRVIGLGGEYVANGIDRFIAARFIAGSVTAFDNALRIVSIPISLFGMTFSVAAFPTLSRLYQQNEQSKFGKLLVRLLNQVFFLAIPVTVAFLVLRVSIVRLTIGLFGGKFDFEDTYLTAWGVMFLSLGLVVSSGRSLIYRAFYACGDTIRPLYAGIFTMTMGIVTGILFTNYFSHFNRFDFTQIHWSKEYFFQTAQGKGAIGGLALSSSVVFTLEFILLLFLLQRSAAKINMIELIYKFLKKVLAGTIMLIFMFVIFKSWGDTGYQEKTVFLALFVLFTSLAGGGVYLLIAYFLGVQEVMTFFNFLVRLKVNKILRPFKRHIPIYIHTD